MSQVNVSHLTFDNDNTIYNLEDETARAEIAALHVELTQAEYDALTPEEKNNGTEYFITDATDSGDFSYLENRLSVLDGKSNTLNEIATLEVTDVKGIIHSSASPKYTFIKNKGENDCYISATDNVGEGVDGTILLQSNSTIMLENLSDVNYICNNGKTTVICVCFQNSVNDPFARDESISSSGGGGSTIGMEEIVLWENDGMTNPQTITLSEAWSDFDELMMVVTDRNQTPTINETTKHTNTMGVGKNVALWYNSETTQGTYSVTSNTVFTKLSASGDYYIQKIIGRRYTRANPSGYRQTVLWENSGNTNPDTITLSEAYTNFDEIVVYDGGSGKGMASNIYVQSVLSQNAIIGIIEDEYRRIWYQIASPTTLNKVDEDTYKNMALHFIIGIKY